VAEDRLRGWLKWADSREEAAGRTGSNAQVTPLKQQQQLQERVCLQWLL
jgi:hypothetical protein